MRLQKEDIIQSRSDQRRERWWSCCGSVRGGTARWRRAPRRRRAGTGTSSRSGTSPTRHDWLSRTREMSKFLLSSVFNQSLDIISIPFRYQQFGLNRPSPATGEVARAYHIHGPVLRGHQPHNPLHLDPRLAQLQRRRLLPRPTRRVRSSISGGWVRFNRFKPWNAAYKHLIPVTLSSFTTNVQVLNNIFLLQINEEGLGVVVTSFKGGADGKGMRDAVESVVDDLETVLLQWRMPGNGLHFGVYII